MRRARTLLLAASFLAAIPLIAVAQDEAKKGRGNQNGGNRGGFGGPGGNFGGPGGGFPGGGFGGPGGRGGWGRRSPIDETPIDQLINYEAVRKDIGMKDEQYEKWKTKQQEIRTKVGEESRKMFEQMRSNGGPRPDFNSAISRENMRAFGEQMKQQGEAAVMSLLSQKQILRLRQIALQKQGGAALARQDIATQVGLMPAQFQQIQDMVEKGKQEFNRISDDRNKFFGENMRGMRNEDNDARTAMRSKMEEEMQKFSKEEGSTRKKLNDAIGKLLNANQKASWKRLTGKPFDVSLLEQQRPGFPGGPRGEREGGGRPGEEATKGADATKSESAKSGDAKSESAKTARGANRRPANDDN